MTLTNFADRLKEVDAINDEGKAIRIIVPKNLFEMRFEQIEFALEYYKDQKQKAAKALGINRRTLYRYIREIEARKISGTPAPIPNMEDY